MAIEYLTACLIVPSFGTWASMKNTCGLDGDASTYVGGSYSPDRLRSGLNLMQRRAVARRAATSRIIKCAPVPTVRV
jgi:hypothetical protein